MNGLLYRGQRIALFLLLGIIAATIIVLVVTSGLPGESPLKFPGLVIGTILGVVSGLIAIAQTSLVQRLLKGSPARARRVTIPQLVSHLVERQLLVRAEAVGHQPIYELDSGYWTNLELDFSKLSNDGNSLDLLASTVLQQLPRSKTRALVEPLDLGQSQPEVRQVLDNIRDRIPAQFIRVADIHKFGRVDVVVATFTPQVRRFLLEKAEYISSAVFLIGPHADYLGMIFSGLAFRSTSLISSDTLQQISAGVRESMLA